MIVPPLLMLPNLLNITQQPFGPQPLFIATFYLTSPRHYRTLPR
jgi:hypothetical protein